MRVRAATGHDYDAFVRLFPELRTGDPIPDRERWQTELQPATWIAEEAGTAIPAFISNVDAISSKLQGLEANPLGGMMGYAFAEYVWLEA